MPQIWRIGPCRHWHVRRVPVAAQGLPLAEQVQKLLELRWQEGMDWLNGTFWLVFEEVELTPFGGSARSCMEHWPAASYIEAAIDDRYRAQVETRVISELGPDDAGVDRSKLRLAIQFGI